MEGEKTILDKRTFDPIMGIGLVLWCLTSLFNNISAIQWWLVSSYNVVSLDPITKTIEPTYLDIYLQTMWPIPTTRDLWFQLWTPNYFKIRFQRIEILI